MSSFIPRTDSDDVPVWKGGKYCDGCQAANECVGGENQEHHYGGCIKPPWAEEVPDIDEEEEVLVRKKRRIEELHQELHTMKNNIDRIERDIMALQESFSKDK